MTTFKDHNLSLLRADPRVLIGLTLCMCSCGCVAIGPRSFDQRDQHGRTYYIDGAGNWGFGTVAVPQGLRQAGYQGRVALFGWSATWNPLLDQTIGRSVARARGRHLAHDIERYKRRFPNKQVHIIALSAGTGVAVWACEHLKPPANVENLVLVASSLSSTYNMRKALAGIHGQVYVYHSSHDLILRGPVEALGTIDGEYDAEPAGVVGLRPGNVPADRIVNIPWTEQFEKYGWYGTHMTSIEKDFVQNVLAAHIIGGEPATPNPLDRIMVSANHMP